MYVKSAQKQAKRESAHKKPTERFEQYPETIKASLSKKRGVEQEEKVNRRIGRAMKKRHTPDCKTVT
jgi:hypothetical protein